jgi:glycosyltransferase involved in cell wall biosynthesis
MEERARALGARVIHSPVPLGRKAKFIRALRAELVSGEYDVLHCHHDIVSAVYLLAASGIRMRRRIVHVHNADEVVPAGGWLKPHLYREPLRKICLLMADRIVGISNHTLDTFLGRRARRTGRDSVHYYGVDSALFENVSADRLAFRRLCDLPENASILLFGGRLVPEKNPVFAVEVLAALRDMHPQAVAVFAGAGSEEKHVLLRAREFGVADSVRMLGWRDDLAEIMSCSDWFILPHPEHPVEGFGLAVVEAQLAGLRMLISRGILDDPLLPTASFRRLPLSDGPSVWAMAAIELLRDPPPSRGAAILALKETPMDMDRALENLLTLHS